MEICEPVALTKLPRPSQSGGKVQFGSVWALRGQSRKRRHEVCTAIDGDSVNIHGIQNGRILLSYAVPPSTAFACAPTSIRWKQDNQILRQTYFVTRHEGLKLRSILTRDDSVPKGQDLRSADLQVSESPIINIDLVPSQDDHYALVVQADGTVTVATADLQQVSTTRIPNLPAIEGSHLLAASALAANDAQKTVLKSRQDISRDLSDRFAIIVAVVKTPSDDSISSTSECLRYGAWSVSLPPQRLEIEQLISHALPLPGLEASKKQTDFVPSFTPGAPSIVLTSHNEVRRFDVTGLVPRQLPDMRSNLLGHQDVILVSNGLALVAFQDSFRLVDPEFGVVQTTLDLNSTLLRRKRKRSGSEVPGAALDFVCYFTQLRRVLIYSRSHLIACDLKLPSKSDDEPNAELLVNKIGRGKSRLHHKNLPLNLTVGQDRTSSSSTEAWSKCRESLISAQQAGDAVDFETSALIFLEKHENYDRKGAQNSQPSASKLSETQKDFILSKLFTTEAVNREGNQQIQLRLSMRVPKLIKWLKHTGVLSRKRLERALNSAYESSRIKIEPGDITQSLFRADPSCEALSAYLQGGSGADCHEQAAAVRILLVRILNRSSAASQHLITEGQDPTGMDMEAARPRDSQGAMGAEEEKLLTAMLTKAVSGLGLLDVKSISSVLRTTFSGEEILGLIQLLRQQLFRTGYPGSALQPQEQDAEVATGEGPKFHAAEVAIDAILKILSGCLDAIGPLDLLRREESDDFLENVIPDLLSEVSLATQAAEESLHIHGTLRETLRYSQMDKTRTREAKDRQEEVVPLQRPGEIITLYSEVMEDEEASGHAGFLPLSLQAEHVISRTKVRKGGGQVSKRSLRDTLMQRRKQKGLYSYERLVL